ncbi:LptF/LptG family permease [Algibacter mikhailovii]|uniref:LptF/LptG family permease n=1 Tax=Algibacter mikhailovii TaxID=425498 RepID=UPI0016789507|nr:LptF/LptG family permease [Algibacter mikhailovii]
MKILDRYILTSYLKTFISVFLILMLIFILQTIWLYIKELAGKDLDIIVIVKFLVYFMPKLIPLVVPLTILLASIMVFGSFAENYEFAAMKSTGISLQRAMTGLSLFIVLLGIVTFFFSNNVIPWAELNSYNLRRNIAKLKPAMLLAEGQFNEVGTYNIKFADKSGDRDQFLKDVTIHVKGADGRTNTTVIKSKTGELASEKDSNVLKLILLDGYQYSALVPKKTKDKIKKPFIKSSFEKKIINIDLSKLNDVDFDEQSQTDKYNMLSVVGLTYTIDSLVKRSENDHKSVSKNLFQRSGFLRFNAESPISKNEKRKAIEPKKDYSGELIDIFKTKNKIELVDLGLKSLKSSKQILQSKETSTKNAKAWLNRHIISFHEKFALGFACIILFFVGAPLGALIRKGGIGLPMVIAIVLFLTYHFIGIFATNSAKSDGFNPILASWFSTLIMLPLGVFLTKRATADRGLFEGQGIFEPLKKVLGLKKASIDPDVSFYQPGTEYYLELDNFDNNRLIDIIKNYREYDYSITYKNTALTILNSRGITNQQLKFAGHFTNQKYEEALRLKNVFMEDSQLALILYTIFAILAITGKILENNYYDSFGTPLFKVSIGFGVIYFFAFLRSFISGSIFNKHIGQDSLTKSVLFIVIGLPLNFVVYIIQMRKANKNIHLADKTES